MSPPAHSALHAAPMAYLQGWVHPQARHEYRQESQAAPPLRAVLIVRTVAGVLCELALRI